MSLVSMTLRWFFPPTGPSQARQKSPAAEGFSRDESGRKAAVTAPVRTLAPCRARRAGADFERAIGFVSQFSYFALPASDLAKRRRRRRAWGSGAARQSRRIAGEPLLRRG